MKISREDKKMVLLDSYDVLKCSYERNARALSKTIGALSGIDFDKAIELWRDLVLRNRNSLSNPDSESGYMMSCIMADISSAGNREKVYFLVVEDAFLRECTYQESYGIKGSPLWAIRFLVENNNLALAESAMSLLLARRNHQCSAFQIMDLTFPFYCPKFSDEAFKMVSDWIETIDDNCQRKLLHERIEKIMQQ